MDVTAKLIEDDHQWDWYFNALDQKARAEKPARQMNEAYPGFYRNYKGAPLAIWNAGGQQYFSIGRALDGSGPQRDLGAEEAASVRNDFQNWDPVPEELYRGFILNGRWADQSTAVADDIQAAKGPDADTFEGISRRVEALRAEADAAKPAASKEEADAADHLIRRIGVVQKLAKDKKEIEYRPHKVKCNEVSAKWNTIIIDDSYIKAFKNRVILPWQRAEHERLTKENVERAREAAAATAVAENKPMPNDFPVEPVRVLSGNKGGGGRRSSLRPVTRARITDVDAFIAEVKGFDEFRTALQSIADSMAKVPAEKRAKISGVEFYEDMETV